MKTNSIRILPLIASLLFASQMVARSASYSSAEITRVHKEVKVLKANAVPRTATEGLQIKPVTSVATGSDARAELRFPDQTLTRLGANSRLTLRGESRTLDLDHGVMMLQVPKNQGGAKVRTAGVTAAVTGTSVLIEYHPGGVVKLIVIEGECVLSLNRDRGEFQVLRAGQMVSMSDGAASIPSPVDIDLGKLLQTSKLISADDPSQPNQQQIMQAVQVQQRLITTGDLVDRNLVLSNPGITIGLNNNTNSNVITPQPPAPVTITPLPHHPEPP
jgi:hypothetical protein|uniref:FecR family protein n=1 Tax=Prosthecobacter sp. TaxID=1965333 RepID=UPI003784A6B4